MNMRRRLDRLERHIDPDHCPVCAARPAVELHDEADGPLPPLERCPACGRLPSGFIRIVLCERPAKPAWQVDAPVQPSPTMADGRK